MPYHVKEMFYTLQGEGANTGRPAVFCRFAGCNLWSGHEEDRTTALCRFCDTEFVGGTRYEYPGVLAASLRSLWSSGGRPFLVLTGGEPTLQITDPLLHELHAVGFFIAIETNGTRPVSPYLDWVTVSPKAGSQIIQRRGDELKVVWPQDGLDLEEMRSWDFTHFFLQPRADLDVTTSVVQKCLDEGWRLSLQIHKLLGLR